MKTDWQSVPVPAGLSNRPRDARGFPITFVTLMDSNGRPDFTVIDGRKILRCIQEQLCGLCGTTLFQPVAFIGGPLACGERAFLDPPMHPECAEYAMQVCPHIATPTARYSKPDLSDGREVFDAVDPNRPDTFGLYVTDGYSLAEYEGQPIFVANPPTTLTWQEAS
jgi:hypothetical protein